MKEITDFDEGVHNEIARTSRLLNVPFTTAEALAASVVVYRTLGLDRELAVLCMQELAKRRQEGLQFDYEAYIEEELSKMPQSRNMDLVELSKNVQKGIVNNTKVTNLLKGIKI